MTNEPKTKQETTTTIYELTCGTTINYHRVVSDKESSAEFADKVAGIERLLLEESVDDSWIH